MTVSSLNIRSGPGTTYEVIGKLPLGTKVKVNSISFDWIIIAYTAYINYRPRNGGEDPGATNGNIYKKNITLNIATLVK